MTRSNRFVIAVLAFSLAAAAAYYVLPWTDVWLWVSVAAIPLLALYGARLRREQLLERLAERGGNASGFCGFCDEPASPGCCPGCGRTLVEGNIRESPRGPLGRHRKKVIAAMSLVVLSAGGYLGYEHGHWQPYVSTDRLLDLQGRGSYKVIGELDRRLLAGQMEEDQEARFLQQAIRAELKMRNPYPAEVHIGPELFVNFMIARIGAGRQYVMRDYKIFIDDSAQPAYAATGPVWSKDRFGGRWKLWAPKLEPGVHRIRVVCTLTITSATKDAEIDQQTLVTSSFETSLRVRIMNKPSSEFVAPVYDAKLAAAVEPLISFRTELRSDRDPKAGEPRDRPRLIVHSGGISAFVAAIVEARPSGASPYTPLGACHLAAYQAVGYWLDEKLKLDGVETIDVRLRASAMEAVYGCPVDSNEYYGGDIERVQIWVPRQRTQDVFSILRQPR